jgi:hypothetical protein
VLNEARMKNDNMLIHHSSGKVAIIKIFHERMSVTQTEGPNPSLIRRWTCSDDLNEMRIQQSTIAINGKYIFDNHHIDYFLTNDTQPHPNVYVYHPNVSDLKEITEWISSYYNNRFVLVTDNMYTYVLQDDLPYNFNSDIHDYKEGDRRILIKYVILLNIVYSTI